MRIKPAQHHDSKGETNLAVRRSHTHEEVWGPHRCADTARKCAFVAHTIAAAHHVDAEELRSTQRCRAPVASARQTAMYLAHVSCGLSLSEVGYGFGRDRTTVAHACRRVEDRRDRDEADLALDYLEAAIVEWFGAERMRHERGTKSAVSV